MKKNWIFSKLTVCLALFIFLIGITVIGIVYFWTYYTYGNLFEDKVIQSYTHKQNEDTGVYNEWILGVTTDNIVVIEAIHTEEVAEELLNKAKSQEETIGRYREQIGENHLLYMIELDSVDGEQTYKYSILKDIYMDMYVEMLATFAIFIIIIWGLSIFLIKVISNEHYKNIYELTTKIRDIAYSKEYTHITIESDDQDIVTLVNSFNYMKDSLQEKENLEQSVLQYISHELKTPIMIIESYAHSAQVGIFPKGNLDTSLLTIINQTHRLKLKVEDLLLVAKSTVTKGNEPLDMINIKKVIEKILNNMKHSFTGKNIIFELENTIYINGYPSKLEVLFENLIHNQLKFSDKEIQITVQAENDNITISFFNDGESLTDSEKKNLFKPFAKGYNGSTGLGLSICRAIATMHKGEICLGDTEKGTLFKVILSKDFTILH